PEALVPALARDRELDVARARTEEDAVARARRQRAPRRRERHVVVRGQRGEELRVVARRAAAAPGRDRALERRALVGYDERRVEGLLRAEPRALGTGAVRAAPREGARRDLGKRHAAVGARALLREEPAAALAVLDHGEPGREPQRRRERFRDAP